jgi:hypothetical protein
MKTYTALFAVDVPHYGTEHIEAESPAAAIAVAKTMDPADVCNDPDWSNSACARIVSITDDLTRHTIAEDVALDGAFLRYGGRQAWLLCEAAPDMLKALEQIIARADDIMAAIELKTDQFEDQVSRLCEAATAAEAIVSKAKGEQ